MFLGHNAAFWWTVIAATVVKLLSANHEGTKKAIVVRAIATAFFAVFAATVFTDPVLDWWELDADKYKVPVAALLALTGEGFMRLVMNIIPTNLEELKDAWRAWRGK